MKITRINITSVGGIQQLAIPFDAQMNIICGPNGVGKTTVLESIAHCFTVGQTTILKRHVSAESSQVDVAFEHLGAAATATIKFKEYEPIANEQLQGRHDLASYVLSLKTARTFVYAALQSVSRDTAKPPQTIWEEGRRGFSLSDVKNWFVNRYLYSAHESALNPEQLDNFLLAKKCFSALDPQVAFKRVLASSNEIVVSTQGGEIYYEYLSSGYKSCLSMLLGIIKEIEFRFPATKVGQFQGVVLIDEIELHLHPEWQSRIARVLLEIFPNIQFIVTTHSPHLVQSANPNQIIALEFVENSVSLRALPPSSYGFKGWTLDEVLTDVMGMRDTRSVEFVRQITNFSVAVDRGDRDGALSAYRELDESLHPANHMRKLLRLQLASLDEPTNDKT
jgi:putative AbiEii toxin of type IV toxin-antitoxin system/AAA ATPase-like protein